MDESPKQVVLEIAMEVATGLGRSGFPEFGLAAQVLAASYIEVRPLPDGKLCPALTDGDVIALDPVALNEGPVVVAGILVAAAAIKAGLHAGEALSSPLCRLVDAADPGDLAVAGAQLRSCLEPLHGQEDDIISQSRSLLDRALSMSSAPQLACRSRLH